MLGLIPTISLFLFQAPGDEQLAISPGPLEEQVDIVEAKADREDRLTVPVSIDGVGPFHFLIDTGSQRTVVSEALAARLSLQPGPVARIITVSGTHVAQTALLKRLKLGSRTYDHSLVPLFERQNIGADGIVGTDSLGGQRVLLDFTRDTIEIGSATMLGGDSGYEIVVTARKKSGQLIMTNAKLDGISLTVIVDTGSGVSVGNRALQREVARRSAGSNPIKLVDVTGAHVFADIGTAKRLEIKEIGITNLVIAYADSPAFTELDLDRRPALFLGMRELRLFERVAVDFRKSKVYFDLPPQ